LTGTLGAAVLLITHDLGLAAERAQHLVVMYRGHVVESGPALELLQHPQHRSEERRVGKRGELGGGRSSRKKTKTTGRRRESQLDDTMRDLFFFFKQKTAYEIET